MTQKVKKLNDAAIPRLTEIADDALVTVVDKTTGAVSNIEYGKLKELIVPSISVRNLIKGGKTREYYDSTAGKRTYPIAYNFAEEVTLKQGESIAISVDSVTPISGGYDHLRVAPTGFTPVNLTPDRPCIIKAGSERTVEKLNVYACNAEGYTGLVRCQIDGLTVVRGTVPMKGWMPAPEEFFGGGVKLLFSTLCVAPSICRKGGQRHEQDEEGDGGNACRLSAESDG
ncbi:hypothetical protein HDR58_07910, partial [bacterium]|nr:hypothetical protein [bacterium]